MKTVLAIGCCEIAWIAAPAIATEPVQPADNAAKLDETRGRARPERDRLRISPPDRHRIREKICRTRAEAEEEARLNRHMLERGPGSIGRTMDSPNG